MVAAIKFPQVDRIATQRELLDALAQLDHVALLTRSIEGTLAKLRDAGVIDGHPVGPVEPFPAEGTRECYLGAQSRKLLLMEAVGTDGPYARAPISDW